MHALIFPLPSTPTGRGRVHQDHHLPPAPQACSAITDPPFHQGSHLSTGDPAAPLLSMCLHHILRLKPKLSEWHACTFSSLNTVQGQSSHFTLKHHTTRPLRPSLPPFGMSFLHAFHRHLRRHFLPTFRKGLIHHPSLTSPISHTRQTIFSSIVGKSLVCFIQHFQRHSISLRRKSSLCGPMRFQLRLSSDFILYYTPLSLFPLATPPLCHWLTKPRMFLPPSGTLHSVLPLPRMLFP